MAGNRSSADAPPPVPGSPRRVQIDIWSDYVCPFCYLELPVVAAIRERFGAAVAIRWRAFELRPEPIPTLDPGGEYLRSTWQRAVYPMAAERGMRLHLPPVQPRSRMAMEAAEHARDLGRFDAMHEALFRAFFEDGRDLADADVLASVGARVGLGAGALRMALEDGRYGARVRADQQEARQLGIGGVPMLVVRAAGEPMRAGAGLSGAQPAAAVAAAVEALLQAG